MQPQTTLGIMLGFFAEVIGSLLITYLIFKITIRRARDLGLSKKNIVKRALKWAVIIILSINFLTRIVLIGSFINFLYSSVIYMLCLGIWALIEFRKIRAYDNNKTINYINND